MSTPRPTSLGYLTRPACRVLLLGLLLAPASCTVGGSSTVSAENDRLRREVLELKDQVANLKGETDELKTKVAMASKPSPMKPDAIAALPVVTHLDLGAFSNVIPPMGPATAVRVEFYPKDGRDRFVQCVGQISVEVLLLPAEVGVGEPKRVGTLTLDPPALRDAYRSGVLGTYYEATVPLSSDMSEAAREGALLVRLEFLDATNDQVHKAERTITAK